MSEASSSFQPLTAPMPYLGGKRRTAGTVWRVLGEVDHFIEPFAGSLAVLLARPTLTELSVETVGDADHFIVNLWRALKLAPEEVAEYCDWPVSEADVLARHRWLLTEGVERLASIGDDPEFCCPKTAGFWLYGAGTWQGDGWANPTIRRRTGEVRTRLPVLGNGGMGIHARADRDWVTARLRGLSGRLRHVRIATGDWSRIVTPAVLSFGNTVGIYLDPPYSPEVRTRASRRRHFASDDLTASATAWEWAIKAGEDKRLRIVVSGYEGEHETADGWRCVAWTATPSFGTSNEGSIYSTQRQRERLWLSPGCLPVDPDDNEEIARSSTPPTPKLSRIEAMPDPERRALAAAAAQDRFTELAQRSKETRSEAIRAMHEIGLSYGEIGRRLGISRARAEALAKGRVPGSRAATRARLVDPDYM